MTDQRLLVDAATREDSIVHLPHPGTDIWIIVGYFAGILLAAGLMAMVAMEIH